jgi:hypothetical protein
VPVRPVPPGGVAGAPVAIPALQLHA